MNQKLIYLFIVFCVSNHLFSQQIHTPRIDKPFQKINSILKTIPQPKPKIHANSNSVFGTGNSHPKYERKNQPKKEVPMKEITNNEGDKGNDKGKKSKKQ